MIGPFGTAWDILEHSQTFWNGRLSVGSVPLKAATTIGVGAPSGSRNASARIYWSSCAVSRGR
jgi:hypothetical protein